MTDKVSPRAHLDAAALEAALLLELRGEVRFDNGSRALYATDGSNYRQIPIGVVIPRDTEDVIAAIAVCRERWRHFSRRPMLQCCGCARFLEVHGEDS
jgi:hypothetical protein